MILEKLKVNNNWTLFLDRDGVINTHLPDDYVKTWDEFIFNDGVLESIKQLSKIFGRIIVVTNQQGIGKGLMTEDDLVTIHAKMLHEIVQAGGHIDAIYFAPNLITNDTKGMRKPNTGMAIQAKTDFPEIDFSKSIMVGDTASDMQFGKNAGMFTVFVNKHKQREKLPLAFIDFEIQSLSEFN